MRDDKLKLIYIASSGRSGSTILDLLLGAHASFWTLGEFFVLPWELRTPTKPCGCGSPVEQCGFWRPIIEQSRDVLLGGSIDRFRDSYWGGRTLRPGELAFVRSASPKHRERRQESLARFGEDNLDVLRHVLVEARRVKGDQVAWLVDASKSVYRLLWLKGTGLFDLRVIHLVKDPRAFVYSMCKKQSGLSRSSQVLKSTWRWNMDNGLFDCLFRTHFDASEVLRVRYEELAGNASATLAHICRWLDVPADETLPKRFRGQNHAIAGNPSRFDSGGIRLDEEWRTGLRDFTKRTIRTLSFRRAGQYGFSW